MTPPAHETIPAPPSSATTPFPLLAALIHDGDRAAAAWHSWRASIDIQHLTWPDMQVLPLLNGPRLEEWLATDPSGGILKGIGRRAWSEAQLRLGTARDAANCLETAGCGPVIMTGALGVYLRVLGSAAAGPPIRPLLELRMLVPRQHLTRASAALEAEGWQPAGPVPPVDWLDRISFVCFSRGGTRLYLHWRVLEVEAGRAAACECEFLADYRTIEAIGSRFQILAPGNALLETLARYTDSIDALAWQADAALILRAIKADGGVLDNAIDWSHWVRVAALFQPSVFESIRELRAMGLDLPELRPPAAPVRLWSRLLPHGGPDQAPFDTARRAARACLRRISTVLGRV